MKVLLLLIFLFHALHARENPFEPLFTKPKAPQSPIPLLHISTAEPKIPQIKTISKPILQNPLTIKKTMLPLATTIPVVKIIQTPAVAPIMIEEEIKPIKRKRTPAAKKKQGYKTLYQNYFLKVQSNYKNFKIITKDKICKKTKFSTPNRLALDFDRLQYFQTKNITLNRAFAKKIKLGSHHDFYRMTVELNKYKRYKITPKPYGYLLSFY